MKNQQLRENFDTTRSSTDSRGAASGANFGNHVSRRNLIKVASTGLVVAGLSRGMPAFAAGGKKRIAFGQGDRSANYYQGLISAVHERAAKYDYEILEAFWGQDPQKQLGDIKNWVAAGVDAMIVLALDANAMAPIVKECHDAGHLFVSYANRIPGDDGFIKWGDRDGGKALGERVVQHIRQKLGGAADVGLLTATGIQVITDRIESTREAILGALPNTKIYEATALNAPDGLKAVQSMLQAHPKLKVIICATDDGALGARSAYMNSGLTPDNIFIAGFDGAKQNLELLKAHDPFLQASASLPIKEIGQNCIEIVHGLWNGAPEAETHLLQPYKLVTNETDAATFDKLLSAYSG